VRAEDIQADSVYVKRKYACSDNPVPFPHKFNLARAEKLGIGQGTRLMISHVCVYPQKWHIIGSTGGLSREYITVD
jgi:hypothetical protein